MSFEPIKSLTSRTIILPQENIDTDQIIPARFLTVTDRKGLGDGAFYDWRYDSAGNLRNDSPLHQAKDEKFSILVAGGNFGCGSSREHAPWALLELGIKAVISSDIADIFKSNSLKNGLLPIEVDNKTHQRLLRSPGEQVTINVETQTVSFGEESWQAVFKIDGFARQCLLDGVDPLGALVNQLSAIEKYEEERSW